MNFSSISMNYPIICERSDNGIREFPCCKAENQPTAGIPSDKGLACPNLVAWVFVINYRQFTIFTHLLIVLGEPQGDLALVLQLHVSKFKRLQWLQPKPSSRSARTPLLGRTGACQTTGSPELRSALTQFTLT